MATFVLNLSTIRFVWPAIGPGDSPVEIMRTHNTASGQQTARYNMENTSFGKGWSLVFQRRTLRPQTQTLHFVDPSSGVRFKVTFSE
ncbi:hypothetical protein PF005_g14999 [Phytophthora fragariae]|uniref:Uncharacterized protein n=1 Tax=Phytophthora fragariae TaxID=53985 RepID=A0A6A3ENM2_9STRA|nr:hypothetical protein PF003_g2163 [Phytophthora fragariae]KAE8933451.1 hypothetical protein PF009_g16542 [Phytophthora fragariae]KAE9000767.1 hypothetical protein PF011_g14047 [Phytophthora fragariae]KAE9099054.1 hypothetical protein PF010_g15330 [Phytophthora fragariae]KAE9099683.1 hypothetical protein PF007_g15787 [Phytophthora fragariae]